MTDTPTDAAPPARPAHYTAAVEALLFAADAPLSAEALQSALATADETVVPIAWVDEALAELGALYADRDSGIQLVRVGEGWELRTRAAYGDYVRQLYSRPPVRLSRAALEVLAIVAYRQPCTRADVEDIRGVDSSRILRTLLDRSLLRILGKADDVGRPLLYGTSPTFLEFFGLTSLADLPTLKEYTELTEDHVVKLQEFDDTQRANAQDDAAQDPSADETSPAT